MQLTYADLELIAVDGTTDDRAPDMPLVGFLIGLGMAVLLWTCIGGLVWGLLA